MRRSFGKLRQLFSTPNENRLLPNRRPLRIEPLEGRWLLSIGTLHVDVDSVAPVPDGAEWATAYPDLQNALDQAAVLGTDADAENDITAIWIAEGTYKPSALLEAGDPRTATFSMLDDVSLYGGFFGDELDLDSRHGAETILSGDLDTELSDGDAYHVVYADSVSDVTFDTLTITGGNASSTYPHNYGGGIYNKSGTLTVTNSTITDNSARVSGGGVYMYGGTLSVMDSTISGNSAEEYAGGGIDNSGTLTVTGSTISGNSAKYKGGGISNSGTLSVTNSTISGNSAGSNGGGILNEGTLTIQNTILAGNTAGDTGPDVAGLLEIVSSNNLIGMDPKFARDPSPGADGQWGTEDDDFGDLRLTGQSPAINKGDNALAVDPQGNPLLTDLDGNPRVHGSAVDIGAYEFQGDIAPGRETPSLVVDTLDDVVDLYDDRISLREAILYADADSLGTRITFDPALDNGEILLATGSLLLDRTVQIDATALTSLTINAQVKSRVVTNMATDVELLGLTLVGGKADYGGGIYNYDNVLAVTDSTISGNSAESSGGGIFNSYGTLSVTGSTISNNSARNGGGIYNAHGILIATGSTISGNSAESSGGGIRNSYGTLSVTGSTISGNSAAGSGGGVRNAYGELSFTDSTIVGNSAGSHGGGVYNSYVTLTVTHSTISGNSAENGGGIYNSSNTLTVTNSTISGNSADYGGGVYSSTHTLTVTNSTISGNSAMASGGGIFNALNGGVLTARNTILAGNTAGDTGPNVVGLLDIVSSNNLIGMDPKFTRDPSPGADGQWGTEDDDFGDLRLTGQSPAINKGDNALAVDPQGNLLLIDLDGNPRIHGSAVDIGAYEFQGEIAPGRETPSLVVDTLDDVVDLYDDRISLREAILYADADSLGTHITFDPALDNGEILLGTASLLLDRTVQIDATALTSLTINAQVKSRVVTNMATDVELLGLTLVGGKADYGGGIYNYDNVLRITGSTISSNSAREDGGGIYSRGTLTVSGSTISGNSSANYGGGIRNNHGMLTVTNSTISGNSADYGGGVYSYSSTLTVTGSTISNNSARYGGGVYSYSDTLTVTNSTISVNSTRSVGGGIYNNSGRLTVTNSTISGNSVTSSYVSGSAIYNSGTLTVINSILAGNGPENFPDVYGALTAESDYNLIGVWSGDSDPPGEHNLIGTQEAPLDPGLSDWTDTGDGVWGYRLLPDSPALNAGSNALAVDADGVPLQTDIYGNPRTQDGVVDMGAVEGATEPSDAVAYVVESLDDHVAEDGVVTFKEAFLAANSNQPVGDAAAGSFDRQDQIEFSDGISGNVLLDGQAFTIYGDLVIAGLGADLLTFDAQDARRVFEIFPGKEVALSGMTVTGGGISNFGTLTVTGATISGYKYGSGILNFGTLAVTSSTISGNSAYHGGGIYSNGTLTVTNSTISGNSADRGGGIYNSSGTATVTGSTISGNSVMSGIWRSVGGGIYSKYGTLSVTDSTISGNSADDDGGGVYNDDGTVVVIGSTIADNSVRRRGGGIHNYSGTLTVTDSTIADNSASDGGGIYSDGKGTVINSMIVGNSSGTGGGIFTNGTLTVIGSTFSENLATSTGGAISSRLGAITTVTDSTISNNSARSGGGILNGSDSTMTVTNSTISGNSARRLGGGIVNGGTMSVNGSTISGNLAELGGGIYGSGVLTVTNSTIAGNYADDEGGGIRYSSRGRLTLHNSIVARNEVGIEGPDVHGTLEAASSHNLIGDGSEMSGIEDGVNGNLVGTAADPIDPRFVRMPSSGADGLWGTEDDDYGDLHLLPDSPAIDAGDDAQAVDAEGNPLLTDLDRNPRIDGERVDMGAYEFQVAPGEIRGSVFNDRDGDGVWDQREREMARWTVYLDQNENGLWDPDELWALTGSRGGYSFADLPVGTYIVGLLPRNGWTQTLPDPDAGGFHTATVESGQTVEDVLFGNRPGRSAARGPNGGDREVFAEDSDWLSQFDLPAPKSSRPRGPKAAAVDKLMA